MSSYIHNESVPLSQSGNQGFIKPLAVVDALGRTDQPEIKGSSDRYQLMFVPSHESITEQQNVVTRVLTSNAQNTEGHVSVSSSGLQTVQHASIATNPEIQVTSVGEQVVSQQHTDAQYVVMETEQQGSVYQTGDIVSLSMAASNVGQGVESEQLIEEHVISSDVPVVTSVQWS